jgi:hypothetical protein
MRRVFRYALSMSLGISLFGVCSDAWTAQWLISSTTGVIRDYTQGAGPAVNPRSITPPLGSFIATDIEFAADGNLYALTTFSDNRLYRVQPSTGVSTVVGSTGLNTVIEGDLGLDPTTGVLYGLYNAGGGNQFFTLNTTTGAATVIGSIPSDDPSGLAFDNSGQMWVIDSNVNTSPTPQLLKVNKSNGAIISTLSTGLNPLPREAILGADFDPTTNQLYMAFGNGNFYHVSTATGLATLIDTHGVANSSGLAYVVTVPEPGLVSLLALGGMTLACCCKRWRSDC